MNKSSARPLAGNAQQLVIFACIVLTLLFGSGRMGPEGNAHAAGPLRHLSLEQGLSGTQITCLLQDRRGFLWIGTTNGLNRYDGYTFRVYNENPEQSGISHSLIISIYEDRDGILWVGTLDGLNRFDPATNTFQHYRMPLGKVSQPLFNAISSIAEDIYGNLWLGMFDRGLAKFDQQTGEFTIFAHEPENPNSPGSNKIVALSADRKGRVWIGTEDAGLTLFFPKTGHFSTYRHETALARGLTDHAVTSIFEDAGDDLWVGTREGGLHRFDPDLDTFRKSGESQTVTAIAGDSEGLLWAGSMDGITRYQRQPDGTLSVHVDDDRFSGRLQGKEITSLYQDRDGVMWIGTQDDGLLTYLSQETEQAEVYRLAPGLPDDSDDLPVITAIYEDDSGTVWIGAEGGGLTTLDRRQGQINSFPVNPQSPNQLGSADVYGIYEDPSGALWIGTSGGLHVFDRATGTFTRYTHKPGDPASISHNTLSTICQTPSGRLWAGTLGGGLNRFDAETQRFVHYRHNPQDPSGSLSQDELWIYCSKLSETLWIGTFGGGLNEFHPPADGETAKIIHYRHRPGDLTSLSHDFILAIHEEPETLWIGTLEGLDKYDRRTGSVTRYGKAHGLPADTMSWPDSAVAGILPDDNGMLWVSTFTGIAKFDPATETFTPSSIGRGKDFNLGAFYKNQHGEMFFAAQDTLYIFHPGRQQQDLKVPPIELTEFRQGGEPVDSSDLQAATISWRQNFFEFEFAALSFGYPNSNQYAYMLEGFDTDWNYTGTRRFGRYTNLPGGTYTLRLKGANSDGIWNEKGRSLKITVETPPWKSWWAVLAYICTPAVLLLAYAHHVRTRRQLEEAIRLIVEGTASATGSAFFRSLAENLASALRVRFLLVSECLGASPNQARSLAFWNGNGFTGNFEYDLSDNLSCVDRSREITFYKQRVRQEFPDDELIAVTEAESYAQIPLLNTSGSVIGYIQVLHDRPLTQKKLMFSVLKIFGARAEAELERQQAERRLKSSLEEKDVLLKEVHHRVKNNLQIISGLLGMQARQIEKPELSSIFQQSQDRIKSMALIHEKLYRSENLSAIDMAQYLSDLGTYLFSAYGVDSQRIALRINVEKIRLPLDTAIPCAMIVSELVTNALKHAFPEEEQGEIRIALTREQDQRHCCLRIGDNGKGFQTASPKSSTASLGLKLVELFSEQLEGHLTTTHRNGTEISLTFPA